MNSVMNPGLRGFSLCSVLLVVCLISKASGFKIAASPSPSSYSSSLSTISNREDRLRSLDQNLQRRFSSLSMISFGGSDGSADTSTSNSLPRDVKEAVSKCRAAVQEALKERISRMDVEMPVGTKFGVEPSPAKSRKKRARSADGAGEDGGPTKDILDTSDRELARLFVDMFQPVGGENICVAFNDQSLADLAKKKWKSDSTATCRILSMNRRRSSATASKKNKKSAAKPRGFAAKLAAELEDDGNESTKPSGPFQLPKGTEVALFVAPGPKELIVIEKICSEVGMGTLVVLLNARLSKIMNFGTDAAAKLFTEEFEPVFCLSAAPQEVAPDCLLYRAYPDQWTLARKPKVGQPKPLLSQVERPNIEQCKEAYDNMDIGEFEQGVETVLTNVAGWFR